jgi:iron(II)-dependent oxidoreductase
MAGNVAEWVSDWYGPYPDTATKDYGGPPNGSMRVLRGGSWDDPSPRVAYRNSFEPGARIYAFGARCARTMPVDAKLEKPKSTR